MDVNRTLDLGSIFNDEADAPFIPSPHQNITGLVFQWTSLREALREPGITPFERLIYVRANIKILHRLQQELDKNPNAPKEVRMLLSRAEVDKNWKELCEERHALFTLDILKETESVEILLKRYKEFIQTESNQQNTAILKEKVIEQIAHVIDKSLETIGTAHSIHEASDIHLMIYLDNISYLQSDKKFEEMKSTLGENVFFRNKLIGMMKQDTNDANIEKRYGAAQGFLCLRRMIDGDFPFNYINKTKAVYERSLSQIRKAGYQPFGTEFYHALNMSRLQMYTLVEDLYSPFFRFRKPKFIAPPKPETP